LIRGICNVVLGTSRYLDSTCIITVFPTYCSALSARRVARAPRRSFFLIQLMRISNTY
jgi:hypothetical protein